MIRKFELPYNFDKKLPVKATEYKESVKFFYIPCYFEDGKDTRGHFLFDLIYPKTREDYISHLKNIINNGFEIAILMQTKITDENIIKFYIDNGAKHFIVGNHETARAIKAIDKNIEVIASITQRLNLKQIEFLDEKLYDSVVLYFPFNRSIKHLKKLPKNFKYSIIPNGNCSVYCSATQHWFQKEGVAIHCGRDTKDSMYIPYPLICLFDKYVDFYKIDGRPMQTLQILEILDAYVKAPYVNFDNKFERKVFLEKYKEFPFIFNKKYENIIMQNVNNEALYNSIQAKDFPVYKYNQSFEEREAYRIKDLNKIEEHEMISVENIFSHFNSLNDYKWFYDV